MQWMEASASMLTKINTSMCNDIIIHILTSSGKVENVYLRFDNVWEYDRLLAVTSKQIKKICWQR